MRTVVLEIKLSQDMAIIDQDSIFLVFLDLHKAYDTLERCRLLMTLKGYGAGPHMYGI